MAVPKTLLGVLKDPFEMPAPQVGQAQPQQEQAPQIQQDEFAALDEPGYEGLPEKPQYTFEWGGAIPGYDVAPPEEQEKYRKIFEPVRPEVPAAPDPWGIPKEVASAIFAPTTQEIEKGMTLAEGISAEPIAVEAKAAIPTPRKNQNYLMRNVPTEHVASPSESSEQFAKYDEYEIGARFRESSGKSTENSDGFLGYYQMGAEALVDARYVDEAKFRAAGSPRSGKKMIAFLANSDNWLDGHTKEEFLAGGEGIQRDAFNKFTQKNEDFLRRKGIITDDMPEEEVWGWLKATHLGGAGNAEKLYRAKAGLPVKKDGNFTSTRTYQALGILNARGEAPTSDRATEAYFRKTYNIDSAPKKLQKVLTEIARDYSEDTIKQLVKHYTGIDSNEYRADTWRKLAQVPRIVDLLRKWHDKPIYYVVRNGKKQKRWDAWGKKNGGKPYPFPPAHPISRNFMRHGGAGE